MEQGTRNGFRHELSYGTVSKFMIGGLIDRVFEKQLFIILDLVYFYTKYEFRVLGELSQLNDITVLPSSWWFGWKYPLHTLYSDWTETPFKLTRLLNRKLTILPLLSWIYLRTLLTVCIYTTEIFDVYISSVIYITLSIGKVITTIKFMF